MSKRRTLGVAAALVSVAIIASVVYLAIAWQPAIATVDPPARSSFTAAQIDRGEKLAGLGDCAVCHTAADGQAFAGGAGLATGFGMVYSANITPDPEDGIGRWSEAAFARALRAGISRDGSYLFPAFPYDHFTKLTDDDVEALYAYMMTREPVSNTPPANTLGFPYNIRLLQAGWQLLYFDDGRFASAAGRGDSWNRGAYLAQGLGHCGACHTPRNAMGAEVADRQYAGAVIDDWYAPALDSTNRSRVSWTADSLFGYLRSGGSAYHGVAIGSMSPVVHEGLAAADDADLHALAAYFSTLSGSETSADTDPAAMAAAAIETGHASADATRSHGEHVYTAACAPCHFNESDNPQSLRPELSLNSAVNAPDPVNLIRATLEGVSVEDGLPGAMMPPFDEALSDEDLASLVVFLRDTQSDEPPWDNVNERIRSLRR